MWQRSFSADEEISDRQERTHRVLDSATPPCRDLRRPKDGGGITAAWLMILRNGQRCCSAALDLLAQPIIFFSKARAVRRGAGLLNFSHRRLRCASCRREFDREQWDSSFGDESVRSDRHAALASN